MALDRLAKLRRRRNPLPDDSGLLLSNKGVLLEEYSQDQMGRIRACQGYESAKEGEATRYLIGSMQPISEEFSRNTVRQAERVKAQLADGLPTHGLDAEFEYQGSVTNGTHIKGYSDIDLLVLTTSFTTLEKPQIPASRFEGDPVDTLVDLRHKSVHVIQEAFPEVNVDSTGAKSVVLTGGSLTRKVDVVSANWWNTNDFVRTARVKYRGVHVLDYHEFSRIPNKPFLHNSLLNNKDVATGGGCRKAIRLLKSLKYDADREVDLSSYDICSIVYNMPDWHLNGEKGSELQLALACHRYLCRLEEAPDLRNSIWVPNRMRPVFGDGGASETGLSQLKVELSQLLADVTADLRPSSRRLVAARVQY